VWQNGHHSMKLLSENLSTRSLFLSSRLEIFLKIVYDRPLRLGVMDVSLVNCSSNRWSSGSTPGANDRFVAETIKIVWSVQKCLKWARSKRNTAEETFRLSQLCKARGWTVRNEWKGYGFDSFWSEAKRMEQFCCFIQESIHTNALLTFQACFLIKARNWRTIILAGNKNEGKYRDSYFSDSESHTKLSLIWIKLTIQSIVIPSLSSIHPVWDFWKAFFLLLTN
jgi:hypothetical protein